jgi:hypothetical protein
MRNILAGLTCLLLMTGCHWFDRKPKEDDKAIGQVFDQTPTAEQLVSYLNENSAKVQSLKCREVWLEGKQGTTTFPDVSGFMVCEKPRNFRLQCRIGVAGQAVDIGSNDKELWFWIKNMEPEGVYHCSYDDLENGRVKRLPIPIQPDWVVQAMGIAQYDEVRDGNYKVVASAKQDILNLEQPSKSPQGLQVTRVTVLKRVGASNRFQVAAHLLLDADRKLICGAYIQEVKYDPDGKAVVPTKLTLICPGSKASEKVELKISIGTVNVNPAFSQEQRAELFTRRGLSRDLPEYNLAQGADAPGNGVRRAGGVER